MKKIGILFSLYLCMAATAVAQESEPEKRSYLPVAGDYSLGVDATPFLTYAGALLSNGGATAPTFGLKDQGFYGKYFLKDNRAIRAKLKLNAYRESFKESVRNDEVFASNPSATVVDNMKNVRTDVELYLGYELRRGHGRVQGFWGGELGFGLGRGKTAYEYGNPMTVANPTPSSASFAGAQNGRSIKNKRGMDFRFSLGAFVGVEYFVASHLSLGGELNLALAASTHGQDELTRQRVENGAVNEFTVRSRNVGDLASSFGVKTLVGGNIFMLFYF
ncbi:MAG: hypothetical protein LBJ57_05475 [Prevotellaceae bacterium]|jgi:hypothetical protein|nr:hypothetical protein [Prevotellaceae bacterium]